MMQNLKGTSLFQRIKMIIEKENVGKPPPYNIQWSQEVLLSMGDDMGQAVIII